MDLAEALGLDGPLPPTARRVIGEVYDRLEGGEDPTSLLREAGLSDDQVQQVEATLQHIQEASLRERELIHAHLALHASGLTWLEEWLRSGDPAADWGILMLPDVFSEEENLAALGRILERKSGPPLDRIRFEKNPEALEALEEFDADIDDLADEQTLAAVAEAVRDMTPAETAGADEEALRRFSAALSRLVFEVLLGPGWRREVQKGKVPLDDTWDLETPEMDAAARAWAKVEEVVEAVDLRPAERELWEAYCDAGCSWDDTRADVDLTDVAFRQRKRRLLSRLEPLREQLRDALD